MIILYSHSVMFPYAHAHCSSKGMHAVFGLSDEYCKLVGHLPMLISNRCWQFHRWDGPAPMIVILHIRIVFLVIICEWVWWITDQYWFSSCTEDCICHIRYALMSYYPGSGAPRPNVGTLLLLWSSCGWPWNCQKSPWTCHTMTTLAKTSWTWSECDESIAIIASNQIQFLIGCSVASSTPVGDDHFVNLSPSWQAQQRETFRGLWDFFGRWLMPVLSNRFWRGFDRTC